MEGRRRQRWDNNRGSQNRKPPRGCWQPAVPSWEKEFCKVVGSLDWETLLQMKKFTHLYDNVIKWNDSAGEEAFCNAKKRYWAEINGFPCDISLPDPDLYIDIINWDSEMDPDLFPDLESKPLIPNTEDQHHDPVVIFGDSLMPNQAFLTSGWGDDEDKLEIPANRSSANYGDAVWEQNWGYSNNSWQFGDGSGPAGYMSWGGGGGWNNGWGWGLPNNNFDYVGPDNGNMGVDGGSGSGYGYSRTGQRTNHVTRNDGGRHKSVAIERRSTKISSCGPVGRHAAITVGQTWNQDKPVS